MRDGESRKGRRRPRLLLLASGLGAVAVIGPGAGMAWACSYQQLTIAEALTEQRYASSAVVIVQRVDDGLDIEGEVEVVDVLAGEVPARFAATFDNGGSCYPSFGPGQAAGLLVNTTGRVPVVEQASQLDRTSVLEHLHGPLAADPDAAGPPRLVVAGRMPGAGLAVLDEQLRVLATAQRATPPWQLQACASVVATLSPSATGVMALEEYAASDPQALRSRDLLALGERSRHTIGCTSQGRVGLIANGTPREFVAEGEGVLLPDAFGEAPLPLPGFLEGDIAGDHVVLITASADGGSELAVFMLDGTEALRVPVPGARLYSVTLSPDGLTAAAWGGEDVIVTIDVLTGEELGRVVDSGLSLANEPWLSPDTLVLSAPSPDTPIPSGSRVSVRDRRLAEMAAMDVSGQPLVTTGGLFALTDAGVTAIGADGQATAVAPPQTVLAAAAAAVGGAPPAMASSPAPASSPPTPDPVATSADPTATPDTTEPPVPGLPVSTTSALDALVLAALGTGVAAAAGSVVLLARRHRR